MTTNHAGHDHEATPAARRACRKAATEAACAELALIATFDRTGFSRDYLAYAAARFAGVTSPAGMTRRELARVVLDYFDSSRAYTRTTDPQAILSITLNAAS